MTRVIYFGFPARSHTVPSLLLVRELVMRGACVEYRSTERFRTLIEGAGAQFVPYGAWADGLSGVEGVKEYARRLAEAGKWAERGESATLVVFDASAYWGAVVAREWSARAVAFITTFAFSRSMLELMGLRDVMALDVLVPSASLKIVCTSRHFQPSGRFFDESHLFVGPLLEARPPEGVLVQKHGDRPLAYVSLGTIFYRQRTLLQEIGAALVEAGWQVVVGNAETGETWPEGVRAYPFVNQLAVLNVADLVVTHGGMGSFAEIATARVPAIIVPQAMDQFLVAKRADQLGAAVVAQDGNWRAAIETLSVRRVALVEAIGTIAESFADVTPIAAAADRVLGHV